MKLIIGSFLFLMLGSGLQKAHAQQKLQVVTKTIEKDLPEVLDSGIMIKGRKAEVTVTGWEKNFIRVEMDLIAKHANRKVALEELNYIQYAISKNDDQYILRNMFYSTAKRSKVRSSLSVKYRIFIPVNQPVVVSNEYGVIDLLNLYGSVELDGNFCDVNLERLFGNVQAKVTYGELIGKNLDGITRLDLQRTDMTLEGFAGDVSIKNLYGTIDLWPSTMLKALNVQSKHGRVGLNVNKLDAFNYDVSVNGSFIDLPEAESRKLSINELDNSYSFKVENGLSKARISIENLLFPVKIVAQN